MAINATLQAERIRDPTRIVFGLTTDKDGNPNNDRNQAVHVPRDVLKEGHIHVRGRTRSGKTATAIAPLLRQLIRPYSYSFRDVNGEARVGYMRDPIFIFDLGGDLSLFNFVKQELCEAEYRDEHGNVTAPKRTFRFLSLKQDDDWDYFDPFQVVPEGERDLIRLAQVLIEAFNQDYGLVYGASYYSMKSLSALMRVADKVVQQSKGDSYMDFHEVGRYLQSEHKPDRDEASIRMAFQFLMNYEQLRRPRAESRHQSQINWRRALDDSEVVYFFCPSMGQATTARQVAGLGLYTLLATAQLRKDSGANQGAANRHAWVIVDEFQELAGRSFASLLAQSSKFGISLILANQTTTQLESRDVNLADVVRDNTLAKIYFTVTGKQDFDDLLGFSQEDPQLLPYQDESETEQYGFSKSKVKMSRHRMTTKLKKDEILSTSSTNNNCYLILDDGSGHREPLRLFTDYTIFPDQYQQFKNEPVPKRTAPQADGAERKPKRPEAIERQGDAPGPAPKKSPTTKANAVLVQLLREKQQQEQPTYVKQYYGGAAG